MEERSQYDHVRTPMAWRGLGLIASHCANDIPGPRCTSIVTLLSFEVQTQAFHALTALSRPITAGPTPDSHSHMIDSYCPTNDVKAG